MCFGSKFLIGRAFFLVDYVMEMCYHANENCLLLAQLKEDFFAGFVVFGWISCNL